MEEEMEIYFNGTAVPKVLSYSADRNLRNTKLEYNANGDLIIDMVSRKYTLTIYLGMLTAEEMQWLSAQTSEIFLSVRFFSPVDNAEITRQFHMAEQPARVTYLQGEDPIYEALKITLEEK